MLLIRGMSQNEREPDTESIQVKMKLIFSKLIISDKRDMIDMKSNISLSENILFWNI